MTQVILMRSVLAIVAVATLGALPGRAQLICPYCSQKTSTGFYCTNHACPGPPIGSGRGSPPPIINVPPPKPNAGGWQRSSGSIGDRLVDIDLDAIDRPEADPRYLNAARERYPELRNKKVSVFVGPAGDVEYFVGREPITDLVLGRKNRTPVVKGYYESARGQSIYIDQKGKEMTMTLYAENGGQGEFRGKYEQVAASDNTGKQFTLTGFHGTFTSRDGSGKVIARGSAVLQASRTNPDALIVHQWLEKNGLVEYGRHEIPRTVEKGPQQGPRF